MGGQPCAIPGYFHSFIPAFRAILQQTFKYGNPNTIIKTAVALQGHPVGKCRAPFNYVPEEGMEAIKKVLAENEAKGLH